MSSSGPASGEWEVVSRTKGTKAGKKAGGQPPATAPNKEKPTETVKSQRPNGAQDVKKEKSDSQKKAKKNPEPEKQSNKENKKPNQSKPKQPRSIEQALASVTPEELWECYNAGAGVGNIPKLLDVARLLNTKISDSQMPLNHAPTIPGPLRKCLEDILRKDKADNIQLFLELCLSSIANNMNKGLPATGYKLIIQLLSSIEPKIFPNCCGKVELLMGSYQNKPQIGLSILWAIGQVGNKDFNIGLKVWNGAMLPFIDLRNYSKFIISYPINLLKMYTGKKVNVSSEEFLQIFDFIHSKKKGITKDLEVTLHQQSAVLRKLYFEKSESWQNFNFLESLLARLPNDVPEKRQSNDLKTKEILLCLIEALRKKDSAFSQWKKCHEKYSKQSAHVLNYIVNNWSSIFSTLKAKELKDAVTVFKDNYKVQKNNKKDENEMQRAIELCEDSLQADPGPLPFSGFDAIGFGPGR